MPLSKITNLSITDDAVRTVGIQDVAVTGAKINDDAISGQGALGSAPADTDEFLVSDAGTLKRVDYSYIKGITQSSFVPTAAPLIINGNMEVAQRGTSQAAVATNGGYKTVDRWQNNNQGSYIGDLTNTQSTDVPDGFSKSYKYDCTTADASPSANSSVFFEQRIEAQNCMLFKLGTSDAEIMTLSFWVKATKTGTNIVRIEQEDVQRQCSQAYTVDSTDTWEKKVVTFPADTSGSGITSDNGIGLEVWFYVAAGTTYTSGTLATTWEAVSGNDANKAVGQVNNQDSTSNDFLITGVQLEVGEYTAANIPPFRHESYGDNLFRCERYYQVISQKRGSSYENEVVPAVQYDSSQFYATYLFRTVMRTPPTLESASGTNYFRFYRAGGNVEFDDFGLDKSSIYSVSIYKAVSGTGGDGGWTRFINNAPDDSLVALTGEL